MTNTSTVHGPVTPPDILPAADDYEMIMRQIDPELLPANIARLDDKLRGETAAQRQSRGRRYLAAFHDFERQLDDYVSRMNKAIDDFGKGALAHLEVEEDAREINALAAVVTAFGPTC